MRYAPIPRMRRIERPTVTASTANDARSLLALDLAVMARLADRLPVLPVPEQFVVAPMRRAVVYDGGQDRQATLVAPLTQRVCI